MERNIPTSDRMTIARLFQNKASRGLLLGMPLMLIVPPSLAQSSAPTASLASSQPAVPAGSPATFAGRNFAPGETVTFRVTHARGTATVGTNHTPAQVVADPGGAFTAAWLVCSNDCVGEMLAVEATGQTSGRIGRAALLDLPAPPARPATAVRVDKADYAPGTTAHITGAGFASGETVVLQVRHADGTPDTGEDHEPWSVTADTAGRFQSTWNVCTDDCLHSTLRLTAAGQTSGRTAQAIFTDAGGAPTFELIKSFGTPSSGAYSFELVQGPGGALYGTAEGGGSLGYGTLFKMNPDGTSFTVLKNFDYTTTGGNPVGRLLLGADGAFYGATPYGGASGSGTVFKINPDGSGFAVVANFDYSTTGANSDSTLVQGADGVLYGTCYFGGSGGYGTVYKLNPDGTSFAAIKNFDDYYATGAHPEAGVILATDGMLYGTTTEGGSSGDGGTVYKLNTDGTGFTVLINFGSTTAAAPQAPLLQGPDGKLYGTTLLGGSSGLGTVYKLNPDGTGFSVLINFDFSIAGAYPNAELALGADGKLYGTANQGGGGGWYGTVFKLNTDGSALTVLQVFDNFFVTGGFPANGLLVETNGTVFGSTSSGGIGGAGTLFRLNSDGTAFSLLKSFSSGPDISSGGGYPQARLLRGADGKLYGTAGGGTGGSGTVFKLNADGTGFTVLKNFDYSTTGGFLLSSLVQGPDGALYGTAQLGGSSNYGTVFKLNSDGTGFVVLKNFDYSTTGGYLQSSLVQGPDGALYGTAASGGSSYSGTVFKLNTDGTGFAVLKNFDYSTTGGSPYGDLVLGADGVLYGAANVGGASGYGTVYRLNTDGTGFAVLRNFDYSTGGELQTTLIQLADGALYGVAGAGGSAGGGTVFRLNTDGSGFAILQNFDSPTTGSYPNGSLLQDTDGTLYGLAASGGSDDAGTLFKLNPDATGFAVVYNFDFSSGAYPYGGLVRSTDGNLYGTTSQGGDANAGTLFRLVFPPTTPPNTPPVARCRNVTVSAGANCTASASIDNGSFDPDAGDTITLSQTPPGPYPLGSTLVTLTVTDNHGASNTCASTVTVVDTTPPSITCPANITVGCSLDRLAVVTYPAPAVSDTCDPHPTVTSAPASGSASFPVGVTTVVCTAVDASGNTNTCSFTVTRAPLGFIGFLSPIGGEVALGTGGSFGTPLRAFKIGSTIPIKFSANCGGAAVSAGVHTLQVTKYSSAVDSDPAIDATPTDAATTGDQFQLTDATTGEWHFNLNTKPLSVGTWKLAATLSDGSVHEVWITIKQ
jgi:uncharacterized repeat protein (TIGR03803 family)